MSMESLITKPEILKQIVREKYTEIVSDSSSCCESSSCCGMEETSHDYSSFSEGYGALKGYNPDADLKLGCGIPTQYASIKSGDIVVDLGSGAGNDVFVARELVGPAGKVIGIDMTEAMVARGRENAVKLGATNVEFHLGEIENIPLAANTANVVVSNCVMNLVPNKEKAFAETFRILQPGGHFSISDIVLTAELPESIRRVGTMYAGCVSGAIIKEDYLTVIRRAGFSEVMVQTEKSIKLPDEVLQKYLSESELEWYNENEPVILSITVLGKKL